MSYNVRDDNALFGPLAGVELLNGANAPTFGCIQNYEPASLTAATATTFPASSFNTIFIAPPAATGSTPNLGGKWQILGVEIFYHTAAAGAATLTIETVPAGTADGSGANVLSATNFALNTAQSNTPFVPALNSNINNLQLGPGGRINVNAGATATTGLVNLTVMVYVARIS